MQIEATEIYCKTSKKAVLQQSIETYCNIKRESLQHDEICTRELTETLATVVSLDPDPDEE